MIDWLIDWLVGCRPPEDDDHDGDVAKDHDEEGEDGGHEVHEHSVQQLLQNTRGLVHVAIRSVAPFEDALNDLIVELLNSTVHGIKM